MDFPYTELAPKGQVKVNEGHMEALFDDVTDEDNIMCDLACLSTIGTDFHFFFRNFELRILRPKIFDPKFSTHFFDPILRVKIFHQIFRKIISAVKFEKILSIT